MKIEVDGRDHGSDAAAQVDRLKAALRSANEDARRLRCRLADRDEFYSAIAGHLTALEPLAKWHPAKAPRLGASATACINLADWHVGEYIDPDKCGGTNRYCWRDCEEGAHDIVDRFLAWVELQRRAYRIDTLQVFVLGDMVSGDIHDELTVTNEFPAPEQAVRCGRLLGDVLRQCAGRFSVVRVLELAGNHDRLARKMQSKLAAINSHAWTVYALANAFADRCHNLTPTLSQDEVPVVEVGGYHIAATHGGQVNMTQGIPYYGIRNMVNALAVERSRLNKPSTLTTVMAHFHHKAVLLDGRAVLSPALIGTNEWARSKGLEGKPSQYGFLVGEHGVFEEGVWERRL